MGGLMPLSVSILTRLRHQHETISEMIAEFSEEQLRRHNNIGKWSVFENVAHLAAYQPVFTTRILRMEKEEAPAFDRYVAEEDALFPAYLGKGLEELIRIIFTDRSALTGKLEGMDEAALGRTGLHPKYGLLTMRQWTEFFLLHEAHHLFTIFKLIGEGWKAHE
jgi:hypothetical protein